MISINLYQPNEINVDIHFPTEWNDLQEKEFQKILKEQFTKKLLESYPLVNAIEMEYAFRNNSTVKDWGKNMNLMLIDEVMKPFLFERSEASKLELQVHLELLPQQKPQPMSDEEIIQISKDIYITTKNWKYIAVKTYHLLKIQLKEEEKHKIQNEVKQEIQKMFYHDKVFFNL